MYLLAKPPFFLLSSFLGPVVLLFGISSQHTSSSCAPLGWYPHIYDSPPSLKAYEVYVAFFFFLIMLCRIVRHLSICYFPSSTNPLDFFPLTTFVWTPKSMFFLRRQRYDYCSRSGRVVQQTDLIQYLRTHQLWHVLILSIKRLL